MNQHLNEAIAAIEGGDKKTGRQKLRECLTAEPSNEKAWRLLESITENPQRKQAILNQILRINSNSQTAQKRLEKIKPSSESTMKSFDLPTNSSKLKIHFRRLFYIVIGILVVETVQKLPITFFGFAFYTRGISLGSILGGIGGFFAFQKQLHLERSGLPPKQGIDFRQLLFNLIQFKFQIRYPSLTTILVVLGAVGGALYSAALLIFGISGTQALGFILFGAVIGFMVSQILGVWNWHTAFHILMGVVYGVLGADLLIIQLKLTARAGLSDLIHSGLWIWWKVIITTGPILGGIVGFVISRKRIPWQRQLWFYIVPSAIFGAVSYFYFPWWIPLRSANLTIYGKVLFFIDHIVISGYAGFIIYIMVEGTKRFLRQSA